MIGSETAFIGIWKNTIGAARGPNGERRTLEYYDD